MTERCSKRAPRSPLPAGMTVDAARVHPRYQHLLEPTAQCELHAGHEGKHRNGLLGWYDPPAIFVGEERIS